MAWTMKDNIAEFAPVCPECGAEGQVGFTMTYYDPSVGKITVNRYVPMQYRHVSGCPVARKGDLHA